jgi:hypothetical protein
MRAIRPSGVGAILHIATVLAHPKPVGFGDMKGTGKGSTSQESALQARHIVGDLMDKMVAEYLRANPDTCLADGAFHNIMKEKLGKLNDLE